MAAAHCVEKRRRGRSSNEFKSECVECESQAKRECGLKVSRDLCCR
jgi:hypothetical protein